MKAQITTVALAALLGLAGGLLLQTGRADAQAATGPRAYTECFAATLYDMRGKDLNEGAAPSKTVKIPPGWTPIGGGGGLRGDTTPTVVLCR
ncbi:MAG: hypothetical protein QM765_48270 [Myxococcales bacterium]